MEEVRDMSGRDKEIGWSIRQLATSNFRDVSGSDLRTDLMALLKVLVAYGEVYQKNPEGAQASNVEFARVLLPAVQQFMDALENPKRGAVRRSILKRPAGPSKLGEYAGMFWNNCDWGSDGPILCELCGTEHPENKDESYIMSRVLGLQVVEKCCGAALDVMYQESGEEFALKFLSECAENPTDFHFRIFLDSIRDAMRKIKEKLSKIAEVSQEFDSEFFEWVEERMGA